MNRYIAELVGTFVLVFASTGAAVLAGDKIGFLGVSFAFGLSLLAMVYAIGLVLTPIRLAAIPVTNTSVNRARSIGPAVSVGGWALSQLWLFVLAPLIGAAVAALVYRGTHQPVAPISIKEAERALEGEQAARRSR